MTKQNKISEECVRQYAKGLNTFDLDLIVPILHPAFKFTYDTWVIGHGITTDVRYIGHLYKTFLAMKKEGCIIKTDFFHATIEGEKMLGITIQPPHVREFIYPMDYELTEDARCRLPVGDVYLLPRVRNGMICKIQHVHPF